MLTPKEFEKGNEQKYNELLVSIEASEGIMSLLIAVCDDSYLRDQIIKRYEAEVQSYIHPYRLKLARGEPSLRYAIEQLVQKDEYLVNNARAVITVTEIEKLGFLKELEDISSEREIFFGYLQWTREGLREFLYPIVLWLTNEVLIKLSKHAPDFWSWRRGVFRFLPQKVQIEQGLYAKKPEQADYYARMGRIYLNQLKSGQFADYKTEQELAVGYFKETVALQRELGLDKELANSLNELATLYLDQGRYIEAESLLIEALELSYRPLTLPAVALTTLILRKAFEKTGEKLREKVLEECNKLLSLLRKKEPKTASAIELAQQQPLNYGQAYLVKQVEEAANKDPEIAQAVQALVNEAKSQLAIIGNWQEINIKGETNTISGNTINFWLQAPERERVKLNFHTIVPQNLPLSGAVGFFGHETELQTLYQMLQQNNQVAIAAIAGMGGVGKTELALQYAIAHREIYKGGICWLLPKTGDVGIQVVQFARTQLYLNPPEDFDLLAQVQYCWRRWREGEVLLVLDDVSDYEQVKPYLQSLPSRFKVLMTTRQNLGRIAQLSLDVLQPEAALELLRSLLKETPERIERELSVANQLCEWLGYLPLAVELVGRYLAQKQDLSLAEMLRRLENKRLDERSLSKSKSEADMTAQRGVLAAFELSWQELEDDDKQLGCLLSLFAAAPIPWKLVEQCLPEEDAEDLEEIRDDSLLNLHLLQRKGEGIYQLHPLLREFFQYKLTGLEQAEELKRSFCKVMVAVAKDIPDSPTLEQINDVTPATPHIVEVAKNLIQYVSDDDLIWAFLGNARFYNGQGLYDKAAPWFKQCLEITKKRLGEEHPDVALSLNNLASLYYSQGRYSEAEPLYIQALALWRKLLGEEHPDIALSLNNLALLYYSQGRYSEAEPL
ncbi:tetratricopeptide repeat protein, partial [Nostoc sp. CALU 1950]|uniref:tetratricopeptide repeat protein n=1 Tax=Nostoc sp. CALU 1950 TaxID=3104321 RepID=UPI003EBD7857